MTKLIATLSYLFALFRHIHCFDLVKDYSGLSFFDDWDFYGGYDNLTLGTPVYLSSFFLVSFSILVQVTSCG